MKTASRSNLDNLPRLPAREPNSHKGTFGTALLIGGSRTMAGAIALSAMAALRSGAGKVRIACPDGCHATVAGFDPCYMAVPVASDGEGQMALSARDELFALIVDATCVGLGPGLGHSTDLNELVLDLYCESQRPMVVDADGLNALSANRSKLNGASGPRILTPHPGEFARLIGREKVADTDREGLAQEFAATTKSIVLLKGYQTIITDGEHAYINQTGNPGMATGGSGDVLTGLIVALVCQGLTPLDAARLGAHVHGVAGNIAAQEIGPIGFTARDLVECLPEALSTVIG